MNEPIGSFKISLSTDLGKLKKLLYLGGKPDKATQNEGVMVGVNSYGIWNISCDCASF